MRTISPLVNLQNGQVKRESRRIIHARPVGFIGLYFWCLPVSAVIYNPRGDTSITFISSVENSEKRRTAILRLHLVQITSHQPWHLQGRGLIKFMYTCGFPHVRVSPNLSVGGRFSLFARRDVALPPPRRPITALIDGPSFLSAFWRSRLLK